ncbi:MAG: ferrochelatase [Anaerolineae bacterium]|nr:ferrochelatase [Anaerolineae bacterium]
MVIAGAACVGLSFVLNVTGEPDLYASVWNRVILLATGLAFGWNLVHYWSAAEYAKTGNLIKLLLGLTGGLVMVGLLAAAQPSAGLAGAIVFLLTAFVSYAANAKRVNRADALPIQMIERPSALDERAAVLLLARGEPSAYEGPGPWARRFAALAARRQRAPHWLLRPFVYGRIRAGYRAMGGENAANRSVERLAETLGRRLGSGAEVHAAFLETSPALAATLDELARTGFGRILIVPLTQEPEMLREVHDQVVQSHAAQGGLKIRFVEPHVISEWPAEGDEERLRTLCAGRPVPALNPVTDESVQALATRAKQALGQLEPS